MIVITNNLVILAVFFLCLNSTGAFQFMVYTQREAIQITFDIYPAHLLTCMSDMYWVLPGITMENGF